jgi:segregation and condensation protein A
MVVMEEQSENSFFDYIVEQESFSGPLDLLLHLIRKDEVDIFEIDISRLTDQFVAYIKGISIDNIENAGDFLIMAATLLEIKSRALLPKDESQLDEDATEEDLRANLIQQLLEYKKFKSLSKNLQNIQDEFLQTYPIQRSFNSENEENDSQENLNVSINSLMLAIAKVAKDTSLDLVARMRSKITPLSFFLENLGTKLKKGATSFFKIKEEYNDPIEWISCFMSILEMCKSKSIHATQPMPFGDIFVVSQTENSSGEANISSASATEFPTA